MWSYISETIMSFASKGYLGYESHLNYLWSHLWGTLLFTSNGKIPQSYILGRYPYIKKELHPLPQR